MESASFVSYRNAISSEIHSLKLPEIFSCFGNYICKKLNLYLSNFVVNVTSWGKASKTHTKKRQVEAVGACVLQSKQV